MRRDSLTRAIPDAAHLRHDGTMWKDGAAVQTVTLDMTKKAN